MPRQSRFHVLNHKACGRAFCKDHGLDYGKVSLVVAHLGGGTSVAAHKNGKLIDGDNGLEGDGAFSTNRTGALRWALWWTPATPASTPASRCTASSTAWAA